MQPDDEIAKRYRGIAREEPGAAMDAAILAASRRALRPSLSRRWGAPVSIAAVLVLAFGLTLEMRHEEPGIESSMPAKPAALPEPAAPAPVAKDAVAPNVLQDVEPKKERALQEPKPVSRARKAERRLEIAPAELEAPAESKAPAAFPAAPAAAPPPAPAAPPAVSPPVPATSGAAAVAPPLPQRAQEMNAAPAYAPRAKATGDAMQRAAPAAQPDEALRELERIAQLRAAGRDAEADKALEDFRRDHPAYRIPEAMWERVKPR